MTRTAALRLSILVSMGLIPIACSGKTLGGGDDDDGVDRVGGSGGTDSGLGTAGKPITGKAGSATGGGTAGVAGDHGSPGKGCTNGTLDPITGLVSCEEGYLARPSAKQCAAPELGVGGESALPRANGSALCERDLDCTAFELGYCKQDEGGFGSASSFCASGCLEDSDCGTGQICLCSASSTHGGSCVSSGCRTNAECGAGFVCATYAVPCGPQGFACTTLKDECPNQGCPGDMCGYDRELGYRFCDGSVCGRPFLVEQQARVAPVVSDTAWSDDVAPRVAHFTPAERATQAAHWTKLGQMEHASIAAFARFQLQLLALGAPSGLVQACNQALIDETAHARLCFGLASAYAGRSIGPGPLDVSHSLDVTSLADIVDLVIAEGCIGETSAALEALEAAEVAADPVIRDAYSRIAIDEQRHAELAFRFVSWAVEREPARVQARIAKALQQLPFTTLNRDVIKPCLSALLSSRRAA